MQMRMLSPSSPSPAPLPPPQTVMSGSRHMRGIKLTKQTLRRMQWGCGYPWFRWGWATWGWGEDHKGAGGRVIGWRREIRGLGWRRRPTWMISPIWRRMIWREATAAAPKALVIPAAGAVDARYVVGLLKIKRVADDFVVVLMWKSQRATCFKSAHMMLWSHTTSTTRPHEFGWLAMMRFAFTQFFFYTI